jgi:hypothetical protein
MAKKKPDPILRPAPDGPPVCNCCRSNDRVIDLANQWNANQPDNPRPPEWFCRRCVGYLSHLNGTVWGGGPKSGQLVYPPSSEATS